MAKASTPPATGKKIELADVNQTLLEQNKTLGNTNSLIKKMVDEAVKARKAAKDASGDDEENRREQKKKADKVSGPLGFGAGLKSGIASGLDIGGLGSKLAGFASSALKLALGGTTIAAVAGMAGKFIGRAGARGGLGFLVGKFGDDVIKRVFDSIDPNDMLDQSTKNTISKSLSGATSTALYGSIFGKKAAIAGFAGSLIGDLINGALSPDAKQATIKAFGMDTGLKTEDFISYGSMIGAFFGPELISSAIDMTLNGGSDVVNGSRGRGRRTRRLSPNILSGFRRNFMGKSGLAVAIMGAGTLIGSVIGDATGSQTASDVAGWVTNGMSVGAMFGPTGLVVGALAGLAVGGGSLLLDYLKDAGDRNRVASEKRIAEATAEADKLLNEGNAPAAQIANAVAVQERARQDLVNGVNPNAPTPAAVVLAEQQERIGAANGDAGPQLESLKTQYNGIISVGKRNDVPDFAKLAPIVVKVAELIPGYDMAQAIQTLNHGTSKGWNFSKDLEEYMKGGPPWKSTAVTAPKPNGIPSTTEVPKVSETDPIRDGLLQQKVQLEAEIARKGRNSLSPSKLDSKKKELAGIEEQLKNLKPADGNLTTLPIATTGDDSQPVPEVQVTALEPGPTQLTPLTPEKVKSDDTAVVKENKVRILGNWYTKDELIQAREDGTVKRSIATMFLEQLRLAEKNPTPGPGANLTAVETQPQNLNPAVVNPVMPIDTNRDDKLPTPEVQVTVAPQPEPKKLYQRKPINIQNAMERIKTKVAEQGTDTEITSTDIQPAPAIDKPKIEPVEKESWFESLATSISEKLGILQSGSDTTKAPVQMIINSVDNSKGSTNVKTGGGSISQHHPPPSARADVNYAFP